MGRVAADGFGTHEGDEFAVPVGEFLADGMRGLGVKVVGGELPVGVMPDPGEGGHVLVEVGLGLVLRGEFEKPGAGVPGVDEGLDIDGIPDFGAAEKDAGLGGGQVVLRDAQNRAELKVDDVLAELMDSDAEILDYLM